MKNVCLFLKRIIRSEYLSLLFRFYLGFLFIYASLGKISYPLEFAEVIANYRIAPYWSVNLLAVALPWIEFFCGLFLIIGLRTRAVAFVVSLLIVAFATGVLINLIRGAPIDCGCFRNAGDRISVWDIPVYLLWMVLVVQIFFYDRIFLLRRRGIRITNLNKRRDYHGNIFYQT